MVQLCVVFAKSPQKWLKYLLNAFMRLLRGLQQENELISYFKVRAEKKLLETLWEPKTLIYMLLNYMAATKLRGTQKTSKYERLSMAFEEFCLSSEHKARSHISICNSTDFIGI